MTECVYRRQVFCSFNSRGQDLPSLSMCHAKGGPCVAATPLLRLTGTRTAQAVPPGTAGNTCTHRGSVASTDHGLLLHCSSAALQEGCF